MEDPLKRRSTTTIPSSVVIPPTLKSNGHHHYYRLLHPPSSTPSPSSSSSTDLSSFKPSPTYTSLKDLLLPSTPTLLSPTPAPATTSSASPGVPALSVEISIRNRLVKQAAWAYLQPMASSPSASGRRLGSYFSFDFIRALLSSVGRAVAGSAARACNWLADALWLLLCR